MKRSRKSGLEMRDWLEHPPGMFQQSHICFAVKQSTRGILLQKQVPSCNGCHNSLLFIIDSFIRKENSQIVF
jgi:hypothetical protein